jgi:hypothetical protein
MQRSKDEPAQLIQTLHMNDYTKHNIIQIALYLKLKESSTLKNSQNITPRHLKVGAGWKSYHNPQKQKPKTNQET